MKVFTLSLIHCSGALMKALQVFYAQGVNVESVNSQAVYGVEGFRVLTVIAKDSEHSRRIEERGDFGTDCADHYVVGPIAHDDVFWSLRFPTEIDKETGKFLNKPTTLTQPTAK